MTILVTGGNIVSNARTTPTQNPTGQTPPANKRPRASLPLLILGLAFAAASIYRIIDIRLTSIHIVTTATTYHQTNHDTYAALIYVIPLFLGVTLALTGITLKDLKPEKILEFCFLTGVYTLMLLFLTALLTIPNTTQAENTWLNQHGLQNLTLPTVTNGQILTGILTQKTNNGNTVTIHYTENITSYTLTLPDTGAR